MRRVELKKRGMRGVSGLARKFKILDEDSTKTLNPQEFAQAFRECR